MDLWDIMFSIIVTSLLSKHLRLLKFDWSVLVTSVKRCHDIGQGKFTATSGVVVVVGGGGGGG